MKNVELARMKEKPVTNWLSTGATVLDLAIANQLPGGIGGGRITHIYGWESTAKSILGTEPLGSAQRQGGHVWFLDAEQTLDFDRAKDLFGLDVDADSFHYDTPSTIEELFDGSQVNKNYKNGIYDIIKFINEEKIEGPNAVTIDSLSALPTLVELEEKLDKGSYKMSRAKQISTAYRKYLDNINKANLAFIVINQARVNINAGPFGDKMVVSGGKALDFYASTAVSMKMSGKIKNSRKQIVGAKFRFEVKKNKIAPPHRTGNIRLLFDFGIDDVATNLNWLREINEKKFYSFKDFKTPTGSEQALETAIQHIEENNLEFELADYVAEVWKKVHEIPNRKVRERRV